MQQNIVTAFLTALFTLVLSVITALGQNNPPCVAPPPPANLTVTGVTTNSVSLSWTVSGPYTSSYRIDVKDITAGGFTYPPLYTNALQYTVGGLLPGHLHEFKVYAYYYLTCPLSSPAIINQATLTFIVEDIVSIQSRCEPGTFVHKETNSLPLQPCIAPFEPTYQNDYVGRVKAPGAADAFTFRIIYIPYNSNGVREVRIAPVGYIPLRYSFSPPCSPCLAATCSYTDDNGKKVTLLTVAGAFFSPQSQQATAIISFGSSCDYAYCGSACLPAQPGKTQHADSPLSRRLDHSTKARCRLRQC